MKKQLHLKKWTVLSNSAKLMLLSILLSFSTSIVEACCTVPTADFTTSPTTFSVTEGQSLNYTDLSTGPVGDLPNKWKWTWSGTSPMSDTVNQNPTGVSYTVTVPTPGGYVNTTAKLTCSNTCGVSAAKTVTIVVWSKKPTSDFSADNTNPTSGTTVNFTDLSTQTPTSWIWTVSPGVAGVDYSYTGGTSSASKNPKIIFTTVACYTVTLKATNGFGAGSTMTKNCYVNCISNKPVSNFVASVSSIAAGGTILFTDLSTQTPTSWAWVVSPTTGVTYQGGTNSTSQNPQIKFASAGSFTVTLTASNGFGAGFPKSVVFTISTLYTWNGATSTAWATTTNWTPNGVPGTSPLDEVVIPNVGNIPVLDVNRTITKLTITGKQFSNPGLTLTVLKDVTLNAGATLAATATGCVLNVGGTFTSNASNLQLTSATTRSYVITATDIYFHGGTINGGEATLTKTGGTENIWDGGTVYHTTTNSHIVNQSSADIKMCNTGVADTYPVSGYRYFEIEGSGDIYPDWGKGVTFNNNVYPIVHGSGGIYFGAKPGSTYPWSSLAASQYFTCNTANLTDGVLSFQYFSIPSGTTQTIDANITDGYLTLIFGKGNVFACDWNVTVPDIQFSGTNFNTAAGTVTFQIYMGYNSMGDGGNTFGSVGTAGTFQFINKTDGGLYIAENAPDTYNAIASYRVYGLASKDLSGAYIRVCNGQKNIYNNSVNFYSGKDQTGSGCCAWFYDPDGIELIGGSTAGTKAQFVNATNTKTFSFGTVNDTWGSGINIKNIDILGTNAQTLTMANGQLQNSIYPSCYLNNTTWGGALTLNWTDGSITNSTVTGAFKVTNVQTDGEWVSSGGNTFNSTSQFINNTTTNFFCCTGYKMANSCYVSSGTVDVFGGTVLLQANGAEPWVYVSKKQTVFPYDVTTDVSGAYAEVILQGTLNSGVNLLNTAFIGGSEQCWGADNGMLILTNLHQLGTATPVTITGSGNNYLSIDSCIFNSTVTTSSQGLNLKNTIFNNITNITKTGSSSLCGASTCYGGNVFNNRIVFTNGCAAGKNLTLAGTAADTYNDLATFTTNGAGLMYPAAAGVNLFKKDVTINGTSAVTTTFGNSGGTAKFCGNNGVINIVKAGSALTPVFNNFTVEN